jgi:predicted Zn-ribbon and HTH transcriptional regulator
MKLKKVIDQGKKVLSYVADSYEKFDKSQRYSVPSICYNCGFEGNVLILKGVTTLDAFLELRCPQCQCQTLTKDRLKCQEKNERKTI